MRALSIRYKNKKFTQEHINLDGHAYEPCTFEGCLITQEKGETEIPGCIFNGCKLMLVLVDQALRIPKIR